MESYLVSDLVKEVKVLLDRNRTNDALVEAGDVETLQQDALIEPRILEAVQLIELHAPVSMLGDADSIKQADASTYTFQEPILRILGVRGQGWNRAAKLITPEDEEYAWQHSEYGVKGNKERPYCIVIADGGNLQLEFIPSTTVDIMYIPIPMVDDGSIRICKACKHAVLYAVASLVSTSMGDVNGANVLMGTAYQMVGLTTGQNER